MAIKLALWQRLFILFFKIVNIFIPWHKLPKYIAMLNILAFRYELQDKNLYDTYPTDDAQGTAWSNPMPDSKFLSVRNSDGKYNDLDRPLMGCSGMRFGRNVPRKFTKPPSHEELMTPNPRIVSEKLLQRPPGGFKPATIVNLLAAAWIQFQVHDWVNHADNPNEHYEIPLEKGDPWSDKHMRVQVTQPDTPLNDDDRKYPAYKNTDTHWWDASQLYGSTEEETIVLRTKTKDGKLIVDREKGEDFLPRDKQGVPKTGFNQNWWLGLELLHTLFALEHNAIASQLQVNNPEWSGDEIFDTARLINCALMAKIHTVEWTPSILQHPSIQPGMNANWWGLVGEGLDKLFGRLSSNEVISGIPGSGVDMDNAPYALTEEFVSVYRLHSLIPDDIAFFNVSDGKFKNTIPIKDLTFSGARKPMKEGLGWADVIYSFGINYPGAITIHNFPNFLRDIHMPDGRHLDLATIDLLRDRERGVPRYNTFRRLFHMTAPRTFAELTGNNAALARQLAEVYNNDIEAVDLLVGCLSEPLPAGFGFSDTAFRVFILMAARRIKSDRFLAGDAWCPEVYTHEGMRWVQENSMKDVLCRHFPELRSPLRGVANAFTPWEKVGAAAEYMGKETNKPEDVVPPGAVNGHL